jgi:pyrroline-5-carboxylate reductase
MKKIGIIGFGNMGAAIADSIKNEYDLFVFDKDATKTRGIISAINVSSDLHDLLDTTDAIIIAVKPQDLDELLTTIKDKVKNKLIISIIAGKSTRYFEKRLGKVKVVRVMPNLPAKVRRAASCISKGTYAELADLVLAEYIFRKLSKFKVQRIKEEMMDAATAISGSGPGYYYRFCPKAYDTPELIKFEREYFIPSLSASAQEIGFSKKQADVLAEATAEGSRVLLQKTKDSPDKLKEKVTSKRGTTEAALKVFKKTGARYPSKKIPDKKVWKRAVRAALRRAKELSKS